MKRFNSMNNKRIAAVCLTLLMLCAGTVGANAEDYVASVTVSGTTTEYYGTLGEAFTKAIVAYLPAEGEAPEVVATVTLLQDISEESSIDIGDYENENDKAIIFDMNGKTFSKGVMTVTSHTNITICDNSENGGGTIDAGDDYYYAFINNGYVKIDGIVIQGGCNSSVYNNGSGTLVFNNGSIENELYGIENYGVLTVNGSTIKALTAISNSSSGKTTITGGTISASDYAAIDNYGELTVTGGNFVGRYAAIANYGELTVTGGDFVCGIYNYSKLTVTGGNFVNSNVGIYNLIDYEDDYDCSLTIEGGTFKNCNHGIKHGYGTLTVKAMPTFGIGAEANENADISLDYTTIDFDGDISAAPAVPIKVKFDGINEDAPFTNGYSTHVKSGNNVIDPARFFVPVDNYPLAFSLVDGEVMLVGGSGAIKFAPEGYSTIYSIYKDLVLPAGVKALVVTGTEDGGDLTYETIADGSTANNLIPKDTPVLLQVAPLAEQFFALAWNTGDDADPYTGTNYLRGTNETEVFTDEASYSYYKLSYNSAGKNFGWYWGAANGGAFENPAHKAYLALSSSNARAFLALPDDGVSGISAPTADASLVGNGAAQWFSLDGRRLGARPTKKGVYVVGGRKVVVK